MATTGYPLLLSVKALHMAQHIQVGLVLFNLRPLLIVPSGGHHRMWSRLQPE